MKIIAVDDYYIDILRNQFPSVMDGKRFHRSHRRKYIGALISVNENCYYAPFSSPKDKDYERDGSIKKSNFFSIRMIKNDENNKVLLGTIKLNNMIPVPMKYIITFNISDDIDIKYQNLLLDELNWINKNQEFIIANAKRIYNFKLNEEKNKTEKNRKQYDAILPFKEIENFINKKL